MQPFAIIATKGRPGATARLLDTLQRQVLPPVLTVVVGAEAADVEGLGDHPLVARGGAEIHTSKRAGLTIQRNFGIEVLCSRNAFSQAQDGAFCVFFDDDFRMAGDWLLRARERFEKGDVAGLTGRVLADGMRSGEISEEQAATLLGHVPASPRRHATNTANRRHVTPYGCNMAFTDEVLRSCRFDENLPLYGWLEDRDFGALARNVGPCVFHPECAGVHLGIRSGRVSGVKYGYSQIANPLYMIGKGTMTGAAGAYFLSRALASNGLRTLARRSRQIDYPGRLRGNAMALADYVRRRMDPRNIETM